MMASSSDLNRAGHAAGVADVADSAPLAARRWPFHYNAHVRAAFFAALDVDMLRVAYARRISLCCNRAAPVSQLFAQLQAAATPTLCLVPEGEAVEAVAAFLQADAVAGARATRGGLTVQVLPVLDAQAFDHLLWACDFNFVRGDAQLVRAQLAARPFIWQAEEGAGADAAQAFVGAYGAALPAHAAAVVVEAFQVWNGAGERYSALGACLAGPVSCLLAPHSRAWAERLPEPRDAAAPGRVTTLAIFCKVVDNYGDVGICWRMARQLAHEHGVAVELWVDDLHSFRRICPDVATDTEVQQVAGVTVRHWHSQVGGFEAADVADIVIEFFGCDIPQGYIAAMVECDPRPVWLNLEGLTAEEWVEGCHTLPSSHPRLPLTKHFFFPGFTAKTGGLLVEAALDERRRQFQADSVAMAEFLARLGLSAAEIAAQKVSMFCYPHAPVAALFAAWEAGAEPIACLVPEGVAADAVQAFLGAPAVAGAVASRGALTVRVLPFVPQPEYDRLLWACDLNFVRGEDSFVRAQWAGKPFVWHIYPQDENLHHKKLRAFLSRYAGGMDALTAFALYWNDAGTGDQHSAALWAALREEMPAIVARAADWQRQILENGDMTGNLLKFSRLIQSAKHESRV
jgi:uncharacterized repeat protein (TIGR03837 family)